MRLSVVGLILILFAPFVVASEEVGILKGVVTGGEFFVIIRGVHNVSHASEVFSVGNLTFVRASSDFVVVDGKGFVLEPSKSYTVEGFVDVPRGSYIVLNRMFEYSFFCSNCSRIPKTGGFIVSIDEPLIYDPDGKRVFGVFSVVGTPYFGSGFGVKYFLTGRFLIGLFRIVIVVALLISILLVLFYERRGSKKRLVFTLGVIALISVLSYFFFDPLSFLLVIYVVVLLLPILPFV